MKVKDLIKELSQIENQDMDVIIRGTGPDDWVYLNDVEYFKYATVAEVYGEGLIEVEDEDMGEWDEGELTEVFIIDGGTF